MIDVTVVRKKSEPWGTPGKLKAARADGSTFESDKLELPWADNERGRSCIRPGPGEEPETYVAKLWESTHLGSPHHETITRDDGSTFDLFRKVYRLEDKYGRADVLIHNANFAGEVKDGEETQLHGCTALGRGYAELDRTDHVAGRQMAILGSVKALEDFIRWTRGEDIRVTYLWEDDVAEESTT